VPLSIVPGTVSYLVLAAVARGGPLHGFAILRWIERASEGALYPALHQMEADGWLVSDWAVSEKGRRAKYYDITTAGEKALRRRSKEWTRYIAAVRRVATAGSDTE
jgi:PadR family transcriptional regulator PadR